MKNFLKSFCNCFSKRAQDNSLKASLKTFLKTGSTALGLLLFFTLLFGGIYPLIIFGIGQGIFSKKANGSLVYDKNQNLLGSKLLGQEFKKGEYFHPRPKIFEDSYLGFISGASDLASSSSLLIKKAKSFAYAYRLENDLPSYAAIPEDAFTSSASGLDPHISLENALLQLPRVAKARKMSIGMVEKVLYRYLEKPTFGFLGEKRVNVFLLNLALDEEKLALMK